MLRCSSCFVIFSYHDCEDYDTLKESITLQKKPFYFHIFMFLVLLHLFCFPLAQISLCFAAKKKFEPLSFLLNLFSLFVVLAYILVLLRCHLVLARKETRLENITEHSALLPLKPAAPEGANTLLAATRPRWGGLTTDVIKKQE